MRRGGVWLTSLSAVAILLSAWVSTTSFVPVLRGAVDEPSGRPHVVPRQLQGPNGGNPEQHTQTSSGSSGLSSLAAIFVYVMLSLFALSLLTVLWRRARERRLHRGLGTLVPEPAADDVFGIVDSDLAQGLRRSAISGLEALDHGTPGDAIIRCWMMLEEAVTRAGFDRDPAFTPHEFTSAVLVRFAVGATSIAELASLYREARFSSHVLGEPERRRAVHALNALRDDLDRATADAATAIPIAAAPPSTR